MVAMRTTSIRPSVTYARRTDASYLSLAAASAVAITEGRASGKVEDAGLARSPDTICLPSARRRMQHRPRKEPLAFPPSPRSPCRGLHARKKSSRRRTTSRTSWNGLSLHPSVRRGLHQSCGHRPGYLVRSCSSGNVPSDHPPQTRLLHFRRRCPRRGGGVGRLPHLYSNPSGVSDTPRNHLQTSTLTPHLPPL